MIISRKTRHFCSQKRIPPEEPDKPLIILLNKELDDLQQHFSVRPLCWQSWGVSITTRGFRDSIIYKSVQTAERPHNRNAVSPLPFWILISSSSLIVEGTYFYKFVSARTYSQSSWTVKWLELSMLSTHFPPDLLSFKRLTFYSSFDQPGAAVTQPERTRCTSREVAVTPSRAWTRTWAL